MRRRRSFQRGQGSGWAPYEAKDGGQNPARSGRSKISIKQTYIAHLGGVDASWRDSYDAAGFVGIFSSGS